jgi:DNA replicative helicase MCM subunit Mcm2 (Cdc46/Mcm family)
VNSQREREVVLRELSKALCEGSDSSFTLADLVAKATPLKISELDVEHHLKAWKENGTIFEPTMGRYRVT